MSALLGLVLLCTACGGGGADSEDTFSVVVAPVSGTVSEMALGESCDRIPAAPVASATRSVREFGIVPDDNRDDADAIQRALDAMRPGETLLFPPGRYTMGRSLRVRRPGITLRGDNAVLHATNPDDLALLIEADDTTVASLTLTAVTDGRRNAARHSRIAIAHDQGGGNYGYVRNTVIRDNRIINAGAPGTPTANSASTGGILVLHADHFLIAGNTVARTLADGIHINGGSINGRVLNNTVRETGDDMIAVVSYADSGTAAGNTASNLRQGWEANVARRLNRNILIAGNQLSGQYAGRGIAVVGGQSISIVRNTLSNIPVAAGILLAREPGYQTFGVENVMIEGNLLRDIQNMAPPYDGAHKYAPNKRTGHGAIEIHVGLFDDEAADQLLRDNLAVRNVVVRGNVVQRSAVPAVRAGVGINQTVHGTNAAGHSVSRNTDSDVIIDKISIEGNRFEQVHSEPINALGGTGAGMSCSGNQRDGRDYRAAACKGREPLLRKVPLVCSADGRLL
jgi:hypothetical protein